MSSVSCLLFFIWRQSLFFFGRKWSVEKKIENVGYVTSAFFVTRPKPKKKSYAICAFFLKKKSQLRFFCYVAYAFFDM